MTLYKGINKYGAILEVTKERLAECWKWDDAPFVIHNEDAIKLTTAAWPTISKSEARRTPALKLPKDYTDYDFCVIQYGKQVHPHTPKLCLLNPDLFSLLDGVYLPSAVDVWFFDLRNFVNGLGEWREAGV